MKEIRRRNKALEERKGSCRPRNFNKKKKSEISESMTSRR